VLVQLQRVVEVILFTSFRALLTSQMHIESVTSSYHELQEKNRVLREANDRLIELDKMKSNFLATVSHELRTPLTRDYVRTIMEKGETLLSLISQILDLSRIESGNLRLHKQMFDVADAVKKATTSVLPQAQKKAIHLDVRVAAELGSFLGDREKVIQVLVNLLGNAVKFTPEKGRVGLLADRYVGPRRVDGTAGNDFGAGALFDLPEETLLRLVVEDSGIGIPQDKVDKVFERFYQVDNSSTREYGGTGLGLSIVKNFIDAHKGEISVESDTGRGARFTILLPDET
jgi:signal transduction histidine kinase